PTGPTRATTGRHAVCDTAHLRPRNPRALRRTAARGSSRNRAPARRSYLRVACRSIVPPTGHQNETRLAG
ncbi:hypothetical protein HMPREF0183_2047, partial [Brevibacterium mcbrellneri ATCC 49030]